MTDTITVTRAIRALEYIQRLSESATKGPWYAHGGYLSTRENIPMSIFHLEELGQPRTTDPIQAIPFRNAADSQLQAVLRTAGPAMLHYMEGWLSMGESFLEKRFLSPHEVSAMRPIIESLNANLPGWDKEE